MRSSSSDSTNISTFTQIVEHGTNDTTFALTPQVYHVWDNVSSLSLSLSNAESGYLNEYLFQFTSPSNAATVVSLPQNVQWVHTPSFEAGKTYYVHIMNGLASYYTNSMIEGEPNVIESISVNSSTLSVSNKNVDISLKTINNMSIYGDGNINVAYEPDDELLTTSYNPIQNAVVTIALEEISEVTAAALTDLNDRMPTYVSDLINDADYISYTLVPQYETDPVFVASPAYTITNANITYWNEKQPQSIKISISYENNAYTSDIDSFASIQSYISEGRDVYVEYQDCIYRYEKFENGQYNFIYLDTDEDNVIRLLYVWDSDNNDVPDWAYQEHVFIPTKTSELTNDSGFISEVDDALSTTSYNPIQNKVITQALYDNEYVVATALNDLNDRMPTMLSELTNDVGYIYQETDPVFVASAAYNITNNDITAWNGQAEVFIYDIDISTMPANGHMTIDTDVPFNAINAAFTAGKVVYVKITNSQYSPYILSLVSNYGGYYSFEYVTLGFAAIANIYPTFEEVFVSEFEHYTKPSGGIPKTDLASAVQTSLGKADTALQSFTETDPVFAASAAHGITSSDISNWNSKTSNTGTITGITMNGVSKGTSGVVDLGTVITSETTLSKGTTTGNGNAVTDISVSDHTITLTKGTTFLTSETQLSKGTTTGAGNVVTDISVSGHTITLTKGSTIPTVNNPTITLTFNGSTVGTFTLNQSGNQSIDIGSIIGLPSYSSSNNGQILGVVNGQLTWVTPTTIYTGTSTPSNSQGNDGDIYLQTN